MWTRKQVEYHIIEAVETEIAQSEKEKFKSPTFWPETIKSMNEAYGYSNASARHVPNRNQLARYELVLEWLKWVEDPRDKKIVWFGAACKHLKSVNRIEWAWVNNIARLRVNHNYASQIYAANLDKIAEKLNT